MTTILGINTSHCASICLLTPEKNLFYFEEERYNREKYYTPGQGSGPSNTYFKVKEGDSKDFFKCISQHVIESKNFPDKVIVASFDRRNDTCFNPNPFTDERINDVLKDQLKDYPATWHFFPAEHHLYHAVCGFHFSPFDEAICVTMDGGGGQEIPFYQEVESVYLFDRQSYEKKYLHASNSRFSKHTNGEWPPRHYIQDGVEYFLDSIPSSGQRFSTLCEELGYKFSGHDAGKLMGLAAYGKSKRDPEAKATQLQIATKESTINLLEKAFSYSPIKNVVLSGGYALNCVNNYEYVKAFPEYNFFVDPVPHDGGTAIGAALWLDKYDTQR